MSYREKILEGIAQYQVVKNFENDPGVVPYKCPAVAPMAYLNILFAPATEAIRREVVAELEIPQALAELYKDLNGFHLLQTISVYGLLPSRGIPAL